MMRGGGGDIHMKRMVMEEHCFHFVIRKEYFFNFVLIIFIGIINYPPLWSF